MSESGPENGPENGPEKRGLAAGDRPSAAEARADDKLKDVRAEGDLPDQVEIVIVIVPRGSLGPLPRDGGRRPSDQTGSEPR